MGCHTWAYRKYRQEELAKVKKIIINDLKHTNYSPGNKFGDDYIEKESKIYGSLLKDYPNDKKIAKLALHRGFLIEYLQKESKKRNKLIEDIESCKNLESLVPFVEKWIRQFTITTDIKIVDGYLYEKVGFDEPCRIFGYPQVTFKDADSFIQWIQKKEEKGIKISQLYKIEGEKPEQLIEGFCPEMEREIRNFWLKYDNGVYVEFG